MSSILWKVFTGMFVNAGTRNTAQTACHPHCGTVRQEVSPVYQRETELKEVLEVLLLVVSR